MSLRAVLLRSFLTLSSRENWPDARRREGARRIRRTRSSFLLSPLPHCVSRSRQPRQERKPTADIYEHAKSKSRQRKKKENNIKSPYTLAIAVLHPGSNRYPLVPSSIMKRGICEIRVDDFSIGKKKPTESLMCGWHLESHCTKTLFALQKLAWINQVYLVVWWCNCHTI